MSFVEAVENLAAQVGMRVPDQKVAIHPGSSKEHFAQADVIETGNAMNTTPLFPSSLYERMEAAAKYYRNQLKQSERAIAYLKSRGVSGQAALRFGIGYAPPGWQNLSTVFVDYPAGDAEHALVRSGLVIAQDGKKSYDRFRDRIMFPIRDRKGNIVGFGGRVLNQEEPKYLNSPETPIFTKSRELYNLASASAAIRKSGCVVVVEGYMDVVMLAQHGIEYVVATLGTATTGAHIQKLLRSADEIVFCFDGDEAGKKAAWRALENSLPQLKDGKDIKFLYLPDKEDPDSYIRKHGRAAFENLLAKALPLSVFLCNELSGRADLSTSEGQARLIQQAGPLLSQITDAPVFAFMLMKRLSELAGVDQEQLATFLKFKKKTIVSSRPDRASKPARSLSVTPCRRLIEILLHDPTYVKKLDRNLLTVKGDRNGEIALLISLVEILSTYQVVGGSLPLEAILKHFDRSPDRVLLEAILRETPIKQTDWDIEAEFLGGMARLREFQRKARMAELHSKPLNLLTPEEKKELQKLAVS